MLEDFVSERQRMEDTRPNASSSRTLFISTKIRMKFCVLTAGLNVVSKLLLAFVKVSNQGNFTSLHLVPGIKLTETGLLVYR